MSRIRVGLKFFTYGLVAGILCAPRSGAESRARLRAWVTRSGG